MINATGVESFMVWNNAFTAAELDDITRYGDALRQETATIKGDQTHHELNSIRIARIAWIDDKPETRWLYDKMSALALSFNAQTYGFDLAALEKLQYTVYHAGEGGHYDWHVDHGPVGRRRKFSLVLQLSEAADYEGCELQIHASNRIDTVAERARRLDRVRLLFAAPGHAHNSRYPQVSRHVVFGPPLAMTQAR